MMKMSFSLFFDNNSRTGRFFRTLGGSYILLGAATLYSFLTIPIILKYAGQETLGMWLLVSQITTYLTAIDAGLSHSSIRQFVGPVAAGQPSKLAPRFQSTLAIAVVQGLAIALVGCGGSGLVAQVWGIPPTLRGEFVLLFSAQSILVGLTFPLRPFSSILLAAQRFAPNYIWNAIFVAAAIFLGWLGFLVGWGIWGLFAGNVLVGFGQFFFAIRGVAKMNFLPGLFAGWQIRRKDFGIIARESLSFASAPLFATATGLLQSSVLSRLFGLEGVALWNVGAKAAVILSQILSKLFESSFSGFSELVETGRRDLMLVRFGQVVGWALAASGGLAFLLLFFNDPFISIWTSGKVSWPGWGTWWVGLMLLLTISHLAFSESMKMLVLWSAIRTTPALDFCFFSCSMGIAFFVGGFSVFVAAAVLGPFVVGICANTLAFQRGTGRSLWSLIPKRFQVVVLSLFMGYSMMGLLSLANSISGKR